MRVHPSTLALKSFRRDQRGFTGAEKALIIAFALAIIALVASLISSGTDKAGKDASRTLAEAGKGGASQLGTVLGSLPNAGGVGGAGGVGQPGSGGQSGSGGNSGGVGQSGGGGQPGGGSQPGAPGPPGQNQLGQNGRKEGNSGSVSFRKDFYAKQTDPRNYGGAKTAKNEEKKDPKDLLKGKTEFDVKIADVGVSTKKEGAVGNANLIGNEKGQVLYGSAGANAGASASWKDGAQAKAGADVKGVVLRETGGYQTGQTVVGSGQESHEIDVLDASANVNVQAGISRDVIGAQASAGASANLVEGKVSGGWTIPIPFTGAGIEIGGEASGAVGAQASANAKAGYFKGDDGKRRFGAGLGAKLGLGLGAGLRFGINLVW